MMKQKAKRIMIAFAAVVALWVAVFLGALYVGFKYNKLLGVWIYDKGDFQIEIR